MATPAYTGSNATQSQNSASITAAMSASVTSGNRIVVCVAQATGGTVTLSKSSGTATIGAFSQIGSSQNTGGGGTVSFWTCSVTGSGTLTLQLAASTSGFNGFSAMEWTNLTATQDGTAAGTAVATPGFPATTQSLTAPSLTTAQANSVVFAAVTDDGGNSTWTLAGNTGWSVVGDGSVTGNPSWLIYAVEGSTGSYAPSATLSGGGATQASTWHAALYTVALRAVVSGGTAWSGTLAVTQAPTAAAGRSIAATRTPNATTSPAPTLGRETDAGRTPGATQSPQATLTRSGAFNRIAALALSPIALLARAQAALRSIGIGTGSNGNFMWGAGFFPASSGILQAAVTGVKSTGSAAWSRTLSVIASLGAAVSRQQAAGRTATAVQTPTTTLARSGAFNRIASLTLAPAILLGRVQGWARTFTVSVTETVTAARQQAAGRTTGVTETPTAGASPRQSVARATGATETPAAIVTRSGVFTRLQSALQAPVATVRRSGIFARVATVAQTPVASVGRIGAFVRSSAVTEAVSIIVTGTKNGASVAWNRTLAVVESLTASLTRQQGARRVSGVNSTPTVSAQRLASTSRAPAALLSPTATVTRSTILVRALSVIQGAQGGVSRLVRSSRSFVLVDTPTVLLSGTRGLTRSLSATLSPLITVGSQRVIGRLVGAVIVPVASVGRNVALVRQLGSVLVPRASMTASATLAALLRAIRRHFVVPNRAFHFAVPVRQTHFVVPQRSFHFTVSTTPYALPVTPGDSDNTIGSTENLLSYDIDFGKWLQSGEGITTCGVTCTAVLRSNPTFDMSANAAAFVINSGISGTKVVGTVDPHNALIGARYTLLFSATTSLGRTLTKPLQPLDCDR